MNTTKITLIIISAVIIVACSTHKKSTTTTNPSSTTITSTNTVAPSTGPFMVAKRPDGINAPGSEELIAIQLQYKEVTLDQLKEGYSIYAEGACVKCHRALNIYSKGESQWKYIIDDMALRANISDAQKEAVYKYVLAIKATQPK